MPAPQISTRPPQWDRSERNPWFLAARIAALGSLFAAPLSFGAVEPWAWGALITAISFSVVLWGLGAIADGAARVYWTILYVPALALILVAIVQWIGGYSFDRTATQEAVIKGCGYLLVFFVLTTLFSTASQKEWHALGLGISVYIFAISVFAVIQFFVSPDKIYGIVRPQPGAYIFGPYVNHNHYAGLMELLLPLAAAFLFTGPARAEQRWLVGFGCCLALLSVVLSGSRAGAASVLLEAAVLAVFLAAHLNTPRSKFLLATSLLCVFLAAASAWFVPQYVAHRFEDISHADASWEIRRHLTADCFRIMAAHPVAGIGLGAFQTVYPRYQSFPSDLNIDYAHNDVAQLLAETGIAGAACLLAAMVALIWVFRALSRGIANDRQWYGAGASVAILGVMLHSWFDFNLHIPANAAWFAAIVGIAAAANCSRQRRAQLFRETTSTPDEPRLKVVPGRTRTPSVLALSGTS